MEWGVTCALLSQPQLIGGLPSVVPCVVTRMRMNCARPAAMDA